MKIQTYAGARIHAFTFERGDTNHVFCLRLQDFLTQNPTFKVTALTQFVDRGEYPSQGFIVVVHNSNVAPPEKNIESNRQDSPPILYRGPVNIRSSSYYIRLGNDISESLWNKIFASDMPEHYKYIFRKLREHKNDACSHRYLGGPFSGELINKRLRDSKIECRLEVVHYERLSPLMVEAYYQVVRVQARR